MNTTKKIMLAMIMIASYATISASRQTYTSDNITAWIEQVNSQAKILQNLMNPTEKDITDTSVLLTTMQSNLRAAADKSVQRGQLEQLQSGISALQAFVNKYAYSFTNNAPFALYVQSADFGKMKDATKISYNSKDMYAVKIDPTATSAVQYSLTPFINVFVPSLPFENNPVRFEKDNSQNSERIVGESQEWVGKYRDHHPAPAANASYDIVITYRKGVNYITYQDISLTKTSDSGKIYTNKTGYTIRMTSKAKKHKNWKSFNLEPGQSTGKASNDGMERVHIYVPKAKDLPKASAAIPSLAPGKYAINYDKATNQLSLDLVA